MSLPFGARQTPAAARHATPGAPLDAQRITLRAGGTAHGRVLLEDLNLVVEPGERWIVLGPNGAGKSSLLAALAGVFPLAGGEVCVDGLAIDTWQPRALAARRAWCPQFWNDPFPASVRETLLLARDRERAWFAPQERDDPEFDAWLDRLELRALADADVRTLSGGERQRVALGTTLLQGAPLLLLDEPSSHLDLRHRVALADLLAAHAARGGSVVAAVHDLDLAWQLASHAVLLDGKGGAVAGPRDGVMASEPLAHAFGVAVGVVDMDGARHFATLGARAGGDAARH
jgi:iron complex transport system ATP-binding protein